MWSLECLQGIQTQRGLLVLSCPDSLPNPCRISAFPRSQPPLLHSPCFPASRSCVSAPPIGGARAPGRPTSRAPLLSNSSAPFPGCRPGSPEKASWHLFAQPSVPRVPPHSSPLFRPPKLSPFAYFAPPPLSLLCDFHL